VVFFPGFFTRESVGPPSHNAPSPEEGLGRFFFFYPISSALVLFRNPLLLFRVRALSPPVSPSLSLSISLPRQYAFPSSLPISALLLFLTYWNIVAVLSDSFIGLLFPCLFGNGA